MQVQAVENVIHVKDLRKVYSYYTKEQGIRGSIRNVFHRKKLQKEAVNGISFDIARGSIVGFVGMNGAGKTTTLKMLSGLLKETDGEISVLGYYPFLKKKDFLRRIALVLGNKSQLWWDLPAIDSFNLNKEIYSVPDDEYKSRLEEMVGLMGVEDLLKTQVRRLSLGERMKMELIAALLHRPEIIFLDEPTIGLDVITQYNIRSFLREYVNRYHATVILTSHNFNDITQLCDFLILINHGEIIYSDSFVSFRKKMFVTKDFIVRFKIPVTDELAERIVRFGHGMKLSRDSEDSVRITCPNDMGIDVLEYLVSDFLDSIQDMSMGNPNMDDIIRSIYQEKP